LHKSIANDKPIIYADRENFHEYTVLVQSIETYLRHAFIPSANLYTEHLVRALNKIEFAPPSREQIAHRGGAEVTARHILNGIVICLRCRNGV
jgi:hypothetical protein